MGIHTHNFISKGRNAYANTIQWYVTRRLLSFFFQRLYEFLGYLVGVPDGSILLGCDAFWGVYVDPDGSSKYNIRIYNHFNPWKWKQYGASELRIYLRTDSAS